ncbi:NAD/NADP transhydrogenase alpha subunit [Arthrobacter sp. UYEF21]
MTRIGIVVELGHERRAAATPVTVGQLLELGYDVVVEKGAGESASFRDDDYAAAGVVIVGADEAWGSEVVLRINPPTGG